MRIVGREILIRSDEARKLVIKEANGTQWVLGPVARTSSREGRGYLRSGKYQRSPACAQHRGDDAGWIDEGTFFEKIIMQ